MRMGTKGKICYHIYLGDGDPPPPRGKERQLHFRGSAHVWTLESRKLGKEQFWHSQGCLAQKAPGKRLQKPFTFVIERDETHWRPRLERLLDTLKTSLPEERYSLFFIIPGNCLGKSFRDIFKSRGIPLQQILQYQEKQVPQPLPSEPETNAA